MMLERITGARLEALAEAAETYVDEAFDAAGASPVDVATAGTLAASALESPPPAPSAPISNPDGNDE